MKKNSAREKNPEIRPLPKVPNIPISDPEITPNPEKNDPYHPSPEITQHPKDKKLSSSKDKKN